MRRVWSFFKFLRLIICFCYATQIISMCSTMSSRLEGSQTLMTATMRYTEVSESFFSPENDTIPSGCLPITYRALDSAAIKKVTSSFLRATPLPNAFYAEHITSFQVRELMAEIYVPGDRLSVFTSLCCNSMDAQKKLTQFNNRYGTKSLKR